MPRFVASSCVAAEHGETTWKDSTISSTDPVEVSLLDFSLRGILFPAHGRDLSPSSAAINAALALFTENLSAPECCHKLEKFQPVLTRLYWGRVNQGPRQTSFVSWNRHHLHQVRSSRTLFLAEGIADSPYANRSAVPFMSPSGHVQPQ